MAELKFLLMMMSYPCKKDDNLIVRKRELEIVKIGYQKWMLKNKQDFFLSSAVFVSDLLN